MRYINSIPFTLNKTYIFESRVSVGCGENFGGKSLFHSKADAGNTYKPPNCCFCDFYCMRAHLRFCCLVSGSLVILFTCEKVVHFPGLPYLPRRDNSPPRVVSPSSCKRLIEFFKQKHLAHGNSGGGLSRAPCQQNLS